MFLSHAFFSRNIIGRVQRNIRQQSLFAINIWNQFSRIVGNVHRTDNVLEGWHRDFSTLGCVYHLNILKFLQILKKEQSLTDVKIDNTPKRAQN
ncbi:hypothetical protein HZS_3855 [Henneguya salminicola]|nr:hypothetical protein HZS_3855 [Henneguya salminicola]